MRTGNGYRNEEKVGVGDAGLYHLFVLFCFLSFFLFCWSQRGESQREQSGNVLARTDYVGTDHPNRRDEYYLVVDSNLSLSILLLCTGIYKVGMASAIAAGLSDLLPTARSQPVR